MKHLKLFEQTNLYKIGDYVLLDEDKITEFDLGKTQAPLKVNCPFAKICNFNPTIKSVSDFPYAIIFYDNQLVHIREEEIIRKLTQDEIEEFEAKKAAFKYNI